MSMHDVEAFAEGAVIFVDGLKFPAAEKIALIHNIYLFHDMWDTSFTKLRVYSRLVENGYFHLFKLTEHPDYAACKAELDKAAARDFAFIQQDPHKPYDPESPVGCYWIGKIDKQPVRKLCCDAGQPLWARLTGQKPPEDAEPAQLMLRLAELADREKNDNFKGDLYYIMMYVLDDIDDDETYAQLKKYLMTGPAMRACHNSWSYMLDDMPLDEFDPQDYPRQHEWLAAYQESLNKRQ